MVMLVDMGFCDTAKHGIFFCFAVLYGGSLCFAGKHGQQLLTLLRRNPFPAE